MLLFGFCKSLILLGLNGCRLFCLSIRLPYPIVFYGFRSCKRNKRLFWGYKNGKGELHEYAKK